jgi:hypothetical protein
MRLDANVHLTSVHTGTYWHGDDYDVPLLFLVKVNSNLAMGWKSLL